jgi:alkylation response protein AidB-like acyl-CoA dehydrogenase
VDFELSEDQAMLREVSRDMLTTSCTSELVRAVSTSGRDFDERLWQRGAELGWPSLAVPEDQDGAGQGLVELTLVAEELGRVVAPGPFLDTALAAMAVAAGGSTDVLGALSEGEAKAALALGPGVTASADGDKLHLSGRLGFVQSAASVDWLLVLAAGDTPRLVLIEAGALTSARRRTLDESRSWHAVDVNDIVVPGSQLLATGEEAEWFLHAATVLASADLLGIGERLVQMTVEYTKVREQFGRPIGSFQVIKHKAAEMVKLLKGVRAATYYAAMALDARLPDAPLAVSVAKAYASEGINDLAGEALQTHGGIGFTWEHDLHLYLRRAKVDQALYGDAAVHHERVVSLLT